MFHKNNPNCFTDHIIFGVMCYSCKQCGQIRFYLELRPRTNFYSKFAFDAKKTGLKHEISFLQLPNIRKRQGKNPCHIHFKF